MPVVLQSYSVDQGSVLFRALIMSFSNIIMIITMMAVVM